MKKLSIAAIIAVALSAMAPASAAKEYKIPSTQEDFDAQWSVVQGEVDGTWTWVDDATPYAKTPSVGDGEIGSTLIIGEPFTVTAGDIYYIQAKVSSDHYDNEVFFYLVYGTNKNDLKPMPADNNFKCWGNRGGGVNWTVKPSDSSNKRILNITESGEYYVGVRSWKTQKAKVGDLCVASVLVEKSVDYPQRVTGGKAVTLQGKLGAKLTWTWPSKTKDGNAIDGELTANIYRSTSNAKADLYVEENIVGSVTGGVAGAAGEFTDDPDTSLKPITEPGKYYYYVAPANEAGENSECSSSTAIECKWVGEETAFQPIINNSYNSPIKASMIDEHSVEISFTPRKDPVNGGWFDESQVLLKVTRQLGSEEPVVVTDNAPMVSPFVDNTLTAPGIYTYKLYVVYKGNESTGTKVNPLFAGGTMPLPISEDFSSSNALDNFTILSSSSSYKWTRSYSGYMQLYSYSSGNNSTLVTAPIKVEAGKTYRIACDSWVNRVDEDEPKELSIVVGKKSSDANDFTAVETFVVDATSAKTFEAYYAPDESGIRYFGFKADATSNYIYLDDVMIEETTPAPAAVADFSAVPDANGALSAHVSFTIPATTNAGQPLTGLSSVTVTRVSGETAVVVKQITGDECVAGAAVEFDDIVPEAGMYAYEVVAAMGENMSEKAATEAAWVGYDIPKSVTSFTIRADLNDKGAADVKWSALSGTVLGKHGGYVDVANLRYRIYRMPQFFDQEAVVAGETDGVSFADTELINAPWNKYKYAIVAVNGPQESAPSESNAVSGGVVDPEGYNPDFTDEKLVEAFDGRSFVALGGALAFSKRGDTSGLDCTAYLPIFATNSATGNKFNVDLILSRGDADYEEILEVYLCTVETAMPDPEGGEGPDTEAAVIAGADNKVLVKTIPVQAIADEPALETVNFETPSAGRYRLALRCASVDNKLLNVHALSLTADKTQTGIGSIDGTSGGVAIGAGGELILPADAREFAVYRPDGALVAAGKGGDTVALGNGVYIVRVVNADNTVTTAKVAR